MLDRTRLTTVNLTPRIGTEIKADRQALLSGEYAAEIRSVLEQRGVICIREINFTDEEQIKFTKTLGHIVDEGENNIYKVTLDSKENSQAEYLKGAFYWHIDGVNLDVPIFASLLSGRKLAPEGGDTEFASTYAAYEALSDEDKEKIDKLKVVHLMESSQRFWNPEPSWTEYEAWLRHKANTLPLVWKHRDGRKSLVVGCHAAYVEGMEVREGMALLHRLRAWATQPQFVYRHKWKVGDLVAWDNTGTMHRATPYALDSGRMMHRTKLHGEEPFA